MNCIEEYNNSIEEYNNSIEEYLQMGIENCIDSGEY
jgi:hypothetical protein